MTVDQLISRDQLKVIRGLRQVKPVRLASGLSGVGVAPIAFWVFLGLATIVYFPVLTGRIPLPSDLIYAFPPWESLRTAANAIHAHAEIGDLITQHYPWHMFVYKSVHAGVFPLWNPYLLLGAPFVANAQSALFYPLNVLYYLVPTPIAWSAEFILRTALAAFFMFLFARSLGASPVGSLVAGVVFSLSGFMTVWQAQPLGDASLWLPLMCYCIGRLRQKPTMMRAGLTGVVLAMPLLAGQPEAEAHEILLCGAFAIFRVFYPASNGGSSRHVVGRYILLLTVAGAMAAGLAAVQVLPTIEWLSLVRRSLDANWGARPVSELLTFVDRDITHNPSQGGIFVPEGEAYAGILTLLLAAFALLHRRRGDILFFVVAAAVSLQIAYGIGPLYSLSESVPVVRGLKNWRLLLVVIFSLAVLAAFGFTYLESYAGQKMREAFRARWLAAPTLVFVLVGIGIVRLADRSGTAREPSLPWYRLPLSSELLLMLGAVVVGLVLLGRLNRTRFASITLVLVCADLLSFSQGYIPFVETNTVFPPAPALQYLTTHDYSPYRVLAVNDTMGPNFNMPYGLSSASGWDEPLQTVTRLLAPLGPGNDEVYPIDAKRLVLLRDRRIDLMNVKYLIATTYNDSASVLSQHPERFRLIYSDQGVRVFENRTVLPRAFTVPLRNATEVSDDSAAFARLVSPTFDPASSVLLPTGHRAFSYSQAPGPSPAAPTVTVEGTGVDALLIHAAVSEPSMLVISQAYYPGWQATVDGRPVDVLKVDYAFDGVPIGPGVHEIHLVYAGSSIRIGGVISAIMTVIVAGLFLSSRPRIIVTSLIRRRLAGTQSNS